MVGEFPREGGGLLRFPLLRCTELIGGLDLASNWANDGDNIVVTSPALGTRGHVEREFGLSKKKESSF